MKRQHILLPAIVISLLLLQLTFAASPRYEITDLRSLGGGYSCAYAINEAGQVVGTSATAGHTDHAFLWDRTHGMIDLGGVPGGRVGAEAYGINDFGEVVGYANSDDGSAFIWDSINAMRYLDGIGDSESEAWDINNRGQVIGTVYGYPGYDFLWKNGVVTDLGFDAHAINNPGQVVGGLAGHAALWEDGTIIDLGTLGGDRSGAYGINSTGQVVGCSQYIPGLRNYHAFLWDTDTGMIDLGPGFAYVINDAGQVIGSESSLGSTFYWDSDNGRIPLSDLLLPDSGWAILSFANDINNRGQIVGLGITDRGDYHAFLMTPVPPKIIYVDEDSTGANNGSSWADAFNYLQDALTAAYSGDEIRVAQGIYKPDQGAGITPGDREATFQLINGVTLKGGYAGLGQPDPNSRDIELYETILTGDLNGNDVDVNDPRDLLGEPTRNENSYHILIGSGTDETAILDGFTIIGGNAEDARTTWIPRAGGGMYNEEGSPTLTNCTFTENSAGAGGAIYSYGSSASLTNCIFTGNWAHTGGAINNWWCDMTLFNCVFANNSAEGSGGGGFVESSCPMVINCIFSGNSAGNDGGGMYSDESYPSLNNTIFIGNFANKHGGGIYDWGGDSILTNCILWGNRDGGGMDESGQIAYKLRTPHISYCCIQGWTGDLGGTGNIDADPCFVDPGYWKDPCGTPDFRWDDVWVEGDYHLLPTSSCINAGNPNYIAEPNETDLDGRPRVIGGRIDMGAYEYSPPIPAEARIVPRTINLASKGKWFTCYIRLPEEYNVADIDPNSVFLEHEIKAESLKFDKEQQVATARFTREDVQTILEVDDINVTIIGRLTDGTIFEATDVIRVLNKVGRKPAK